MLTQRKNINGIKSTIVSPVSSNKRKLLDLNEMLIDNNMKQNFNFKLKHQTNNNNPKVLSLSPINVRVNCKVDNKSLYHSPIHSLNQRIMSPVLQNEERKVNSPAMPVRNMKLATISKRRNIDINLLQVQLSPKYRTKKLSNKADKIRDDIDSVEEMLIVHKSRMRSLSPNDAYAVSRNQCVLLHKEENKELANNKRIKRSLFAGLLIP